jgi:hypothetical protein
MAVLGRFAFASWLSRLNGYNNAGTDSAIEPRLFVPVKRIEEIADANPEALKHLESRRRALQWM